MKNKVLLLATFVLLFAACSKESNDVVPTVDNEMTAKKKKLVPFKGSLTFSFAPNEDLPCDCGDFFPVGTFTGSGNLSHFGKSFSMIKPCVAPIIEDGNYVGDYVGVECAYFVAANGDTAHCYTYPYNLYFTPAGAVGVATVDFVGGSGRFRNATGQFTGTVTVGLTGATFSNIKGSIQY